MELLAGRDFGVAHGQSHVSERKLRLVEPGTLTLRDRVCNAAQLKKYYVLPPLPSLSLFTGRREGIHLATKRCRKQKVN